MAVPVTVVIVFTACFVLNVTPGESQERHSKYPGLRKRFYIDFSQRLNWHGAHFQCARNNSVLASPESAEEFHEMTNLIEHSAITNEDFWLGGNDLANEGLWVWSQGQDLKGGFTNWASGEPNNYDGKDHCLAMRTKVVNYEWNDDVCSRTLYFICEHKIAVKADWPPEDAGEKKFYLELRMKADWHSAYMYCLRNNSRLARIENKAENDIVVSMIKEANLGFDIEYWLGAMDFPEVGQYFWLATGTPVRGYSNWHAGQGLGEDQRCLTYWQSSHHVVRWNDFICTTLYNFVCEYYD